MTEVKAGPAELYLDLIKKTLSFLLYEDPGIPIEVDNEIRGFLKRSLINLLTAAFRRANLRIVRYRSHEEDRIVGHTWPWLAHTMIGLKRLDNLQYCVEDIIENDVPGDLIETGVWRGGACILMRAVLAVHEITERRVFVADSFEGVPPPDEVRYPPDKGDQHHTCPSLRVSQEEVESNFRKYGLLDRQVVFLKGWFKDTLPTIPTERLAVIRLDGDMYESTIEALTYLYPKLSTGGYCIIDDYSLPPCRAAVQDYRQQHNIRNPIHEIDWTGVYWQK